MVFFQRTGLVFIAFIVLSLLGLAGAAMHVRSLLVVGLLLAIGVLSIWFFLNTRSHGDRFTLLVQAGLFFGLIGHLALAFVDRDGFAFLVGIGSIMLSQFCFAMAFAMNVTQLPGTIGLVLGSLMALVVIMFGVYFSHEVLARLDEDIYGAVVVSLVAFVVMVAMACLRFKRTYMRSFLTTLVGTLFFAATTCILLQDRFIRPLEHAATWSVACSSIGLFLIALGAVMHVRSPAHVRRQEVLTT